MLGAHNFCLSNVPACVQADLSGILFFTFTVKRHVSQGQQLQKSSL